MKNNNILPWLSGVLLMFAFSGCEELGTGGNTGLIIGGIILGIIALGWVAVKFLEGALKIGFWAIVLFVVLVIGFVAFIIIKGMGSA